MRILIDMGHPAHVHFWKNFIWEMEKKGHDFKVIVREKNPMKELLEHYKIPFTSIGSPPSGTLNKAVRMPANDMKILKIARKFKPDVLTGIGSPYVAQVGKLIRKPSYIFTDTEHATLINRLAVPFATKVLTPNCFMGDFGDKHVRYNSFHELAYLHPNHFKEKGIGKDNIIIRLSSWDASHDRGRQVIEDIVFSHLSRKLAEYGNVVMSREDGKRMTLEGKLYEPWQLHAIMKNAKLYIGDGATMATECALLGVPAIYVSPLAGTMGNHENLEKYGLMLSRKTLPIDNTITAIIETPKSVWKEKQQRMIRDKIDMTDYMINFFEGLE
jgi:uncharacterized protein